MRIVFLGLPGAGKGTQAAVFAQRFSLPFVGVGDILRAKSKAQDDLGQMIRGRLLSGDLFEDTLIVDTLFDHIQDMDGFVLEGAPRTLSQRRLIDERMAAASLSFNAIFLLELSAEAAMDRLLRRMVCASCGTVLAPANQGRGECTKCGETVFERRADDQDAVIQRRLEVQKKELDPLVASYEGQNNFYRIDAAQDFESVTQNILDCLGG